MAGESTDIAVVGAGPCGLAVGIAAARAGLSSLVFERSCVVSGIAGYPTYMTFFSTAERLSIGDVPFVVATDKPTRRDALAYYRALVQHFGLTVRQYEPVEAIERLGDDLVGVARIARDAGDGERGPLPGVVVVHFRDGDLEALAELVLEALQDVALALERAHVRQVQLDGADRHPRRRHARGSERLPRSYRPR